MEGRGAPRFRDHHLPACRAGGPAASGRRALALVVATLVTLVTLSELVMAVPRAGAASVSSKRREAQRLQAQIDDLDDRLSALDEDSNQARVRLGETKERQRDAESRATRAQRDLTTRQAAMRDRALRSYASNGGSGSTLDVDSSLDANVRRRTYLELVQVRQLDQVDALSAAQQDLEVQRRRAEAARRDARADAAAIATARRRAELLLVKQEKLLLRASGELSVLVKQEQVRQAAAEALRVRRQLSQQEAAARAELKRRQAESARAGARAKRDGSRSALSDRLRAATPRPPTAPGVVRDAALSVDTGAVSDLPASPGGATAVASARGQIGKPYLWGAGGTSAFDCSGLTSFAWKAAGRGLPHSSRAQFAATTRVSMGSLRPGDLLFYGSPIHHVGLYVGNALMLEAPHRGALVRERTIYRRDFAGAGRVG